MEFHHVSVLLNETVASLQVRPDGVYVDCTAGAGGHSAAVLERLERGKLICIDQDPDAIAALNARFRGDARVTVVQSNFSRLQEILGALGLESVSGIFADLGVSSHQLDTAGRGFSFHADAPLDMRMSQSGQSAADLVNTLPQEALAQIIFRYGEERFARSIAKRIVEERSVKPIETTLELAEIIKTGIPAKARRTGGHPARRTFQALRIAVNGELDVLETTLNEMFDALEVGGRLSVITFHSLEDRIVKQKMQQWAKGCTCPPEFPVCVCGNTPRARVLKAVAPSEKEAEENPRARSARLRSAEKLRM
ncbi:MAG: 16S rRNA (cytosine(1402)-N(4))-methyltransferase RsmH [Clostridia bacterium]|nr:16S rRNA (cytosine(1402)-N(4))-methyltransferase RsmH [Clostridia bacterium]